MPHALVGSLASSTFGEPKFTNDIDIAIDVFDTAILCDTFAPDESFLYRPAATEEVERGGQFQVLHPASMNKIDFMVAGESD